MTAALNRIKRAMEFLEAAQLSANLEAVS